MNGIEKAHKGIITVLAVMLVLLVAAVGSASAAEWTETFGGSGNDYGYSIQPTSDGGYIIGAKTTSYGAGSEDFWLVKTNSAGNMEWSETYGGEKSDRADEAIQTSDGGYAIVGDTWTYVGGTPASNNMDAWLVKTDSSGTEEWNETYGSGDIQDYGNSVKQTRDGGYIIAGMTRAHNLPDFNYDGWLIKTDSSGKEVWNKTYTYNVTLTYEEFQSVQQTSDDGYIAGGYINNGSTTSWDFWLLKTDSDGTEEWNRTFTGSDSDRDQAYEVKQTPDGGYVIVGKTKSYGAGKYDIWLIKTYSDGTEEWNKTYGGTENDYGYSVNTTSDGGYIVTGETKSYGAGGYDVWLIKTYSDGNEEWNKTYGGSGSDYGRSVQQTDSYIIAGYTTSYGEGRKDVWLIHTDGTLPYYCDSDNDGYISAALTGIAAGLPSGCQWDAGDDCNDNNAAINPGAAENCTDGIDNDCDGLADGNDPDCFPNKVYFMPEDIRIPKYCDTTNVSIWIDTEDVITSGLMEFYYADCCMNVTGCTMNDTHWASDSNMNIETPGKVRIILNAKGDGVGPGLLHIGNITVHCCNETSYCFTDLTWNKDPAYYLFNDADPKEKIPINWKDGTFRCNIPNLVVTKVKGNEINETYYNVSYTVQNIGEVNASASYVNLTVDDTNPIETMWVPKLLPGETYNDTFVSKINQTGTFDNLLVCADWNDTVVETDEDHNCMKGKYPGEVVIKVQPVVTYVQPQDQFDVKIYIDTKAIEVYAVQYRLTYDTSIVRAETQTKGPFLGSIIDTMVVINNIDQPRGVVSYAETRTVSGTVADSDNVTNIHFIAIGVRGATTNLTLDEIILSDEEGNRIAYVPEDGKVEITVNTPPVPIGVTKHRVNNVAQKYQSTAILCSCSYDPDYPGKGGNITYIRWAFGDGQYGTSEGLPDENNCTCKEHRYESWQWAPLGMPYNPDDPEAGGNYVPFDVQLDVMDDGCPELTNNSTFTINVQIAGDADGDGEVNILDAVWVGKNWRAECNCTPYPNDPNDPLDYCGCDDCEGNYWNNTQAENGADGADLNNDCEINILDAVIVGANWRHVAW